MAKGSAKLSSPCSFEIGPYPATREQKNVSLSISLLYLFYIKELMFNPFAYKKEIEKLFRFN